MQPFRSIFRIRSASTATPKSFEHVLKELRNTDPSHRHRILQTNIQCLTNEHNWSTARTTWIIELLECVSSVKVNSNSSGGQSSGLQSIARCSLPHLTRIRASLSFIEISNVVAISAKLKMEDEIIPLLLEDVLRTVGDFTACDAVNVLWAITYNWETCMNNPAIQNKELLTIVANRLLAHLSSVADDMDPSSLSKTLWCCTRPPFSVSTTQRDNALHVVCLRITSVVNVIPLVTLANMIGALAKMSHSFQHLVLVKDIIRSATEHYTHGTDEHARLHPNATAKFLLSLQRLDVEDEVVGPLVTMLTANLAASSSPPKQQRGPVLLSSKHTAALLTACSRYEQFFAIDLYPILAACIHHYLANHEFENKEIVQILYAISKVDHDNPLRSADVVDGLLAKAWLAAKHLDALGIALSAKALTGLTDFYIQPLYGHLCRSIIPKNIKTFSRKHLAIVVHSLAALSSLFEVPQSLVDRMTLEISKPERIMEFSTQDIPILLLGVAALNRPKHQHNTTQYPSSTVVTRIFSSTSDRILHLLQNKNAAGLGPREIAVTFCAFSQVGFVHFPTFDALWNRLASCRLQQPHKFTILEESTILHALGRLGYNPSTREGTEVKRITDVLLFSDMDALLTTPERVHGIVKACRSLGIEIPSHIQCLVERKKQVEEIMDNGSEQGSTSTLDSFTELVLFE